jgi:hypothetical protein
MAKYTCPPTKATGAQTFSDYLVGLQLTTGGGLTLGNFLFNSRPSEKNNRTFNIGVFSDPINLEMLGVENIQQSLSIVQNNFKVYPNYDLSQVSTFTLYGSMSKRISAAITQIISYFPAGIESLNVKENGTTGTTVQSYSYNPIADETRVDFDISQLRNPFEIDFTRNATLNLELREIKVSSLRNLTTGFTKYSLYYSGTGYQLTGIIPTTSLNSGNLRIYVKGNPFSGETTIVGDIVVRPNDLEVNRALNEDLDEVENFLLNRNVTPIYTSTFQVPTESDDGTYYIDNVEATWPLNVVWNIDIQTSAFTNYVTILNDVSISFDLYKTNLISRFLTTDAFKEFDTPDQKMEKVLQIYGRSFDETRKFINALAYMTSVNYNVGNDIPSQLLKNLAQTLGWNTNISPITTDQFLSSVFGSVNQSPSIYPGVSVQQTPEELNYQFFRNLILNSAYLFKSKGTRKSVEVLLRLVGAPEALVDFNEFIYLADQKIDMTNFNSQFSEITGGTYTRTLPILDSGFTFTIYGIEYTGYTTSSSILPVSLVREDFPIDNEGYPSIQYENDNFYFQKGSGWFERTTEHTSYEIVDTTKSVFSGQSPNVQTQLSPFTYGQDYLNIFRQLPFTSLGYRLSPRIDNNKSWTDTEVGLRSNLDANINALYYTDNEKLVLNVKNVDLFMNPGQGLSYDVWYMSRQFNYPIPDEGLNYIEPTHCNPYPVSEYPSRGGVDWTEINPRPNNKTFFEFAQTFWKNTINVRNRLYAFDGKTGGYPTLQSIFWKYLLSEQTVNIPNNNFNYENMIEYVNGMGDYWIRLVEQMVPATTIWNTGTRLENSIFHRQKFVWRRQRGCQLIPLPTTTDGGPKNRPPLCRPCVLTKNLFDNDCLIESTECPVYPWVENPLISDFSGVLANVINSYITSSGYSLIDCDLNNLITQWYVDIRVNDVSVVSYPFFNGSGYYIPFYSSPSVTEWDNALLVALESLKSYGYDYYLTDNDTVIIYSQGCVVPETPINIKLNVGINFQIYCS